MAVEWKLLSEEKPSLDDYAVILFPCRSPNGILYTVSNPHYARSENATNAGYTHWSRLDLAPCHDKLVKWKDDLTWQEIDASLDEALKYIDEL